MSNQQTVFAAGFRSRLCPRLIGSHFIDEDHSNRHARLLHTHKNELELLYIYSGEGQYMVDGCSYHVKRGDIVICNAGILHGEDPSEQRQMCSYSIAMTDIFLEGLPDNHLSDTKSEPIVSCGLLAQQVGEMMQLIYLLHSKQGHLEQVCGNTATAILLLTYDLVLRRERYRQDRSNFSSYVLARRIQHYLDEHYAEPITLRSISEALHISEYYLAHVFKDEMGVPPMQYVIKRRIGEAQTLLMDTDLPVAVISEQLGYSNPWNFSTAFRKCVGMSPSQYREAFDSLHKSKE